MSENKVFSREISWDFSALYLRDDARYSDDDDDDLVTLVSSAAVSP